MSLESTVEGRMGSKLTARNVLGTIHVNEGVSQA